MGALRPPNPPSGERPAANLLALCHNDSAPIFSKTDDRYGFVKIPRGASVWVIRSSLIWKNQNLP